MEAPHSQGVYLELRHLMAIHQISSRWRFHLAHQKDRKQLVLLLEIESDNARSNQRQYYGWLSNRIKLPNGGCHWLQYGSIASVPGSICSTSITTGFGQWMVVPTLICVWHQRTQGAPSCIFVMVHILFNLGQCHHLWTQAMRFFQPGPWTWPHMGCTKS